MRGEISAQDAMFSYVSPERRVPADHPLRRIKADADQALRAISGELMSCTAAQADLRLLRSGCSRLSC